MLDEIASLSWRWYPATALIGLGASLALWGLRAEVLGLRDSLRGDHTRIVVWIQGFRLSIIGLALAGIGAAWALHLTWLLVLSLAIGGEETLESSIVIFALRRKQRPASEVVHTNDVISSRPTKAQLR